MLKTSHNVFILSLCLMAVGASYQPASAGSYADAVKMTADTGMASTRPGVRIRARFDSEDGEDEQSPMIRMRRGRARVTFLYRDDNYTLVSVAGDFNDWVPEPMDLDSLEGTWTLRITLDPGRYLYRFTVRDAEGEFEAIDPNNNSALRDSERGWVSRFRIKDPRRWYRLRPVESRYCRIELDKMYGEDEFGLDYQRVDGLFLYFAPEAHTRHSFGTSFKGKIGYGFQSELWSASGTLAQPLVPNGRLQVMLTGYGETAYTDQTGVSDVENVLATSLFRKDFRDYFRREGFSARLVYNASRYLRMETGYRVDDYTSMENKTSWSLSKGDFLPNPPVQEGTMRSLFGGVHVGSRDTNLRVDYETCGDNLAGGDFEFDQLTAQARTQMYVGPSQRIDMRVKYGNALTGVLPNQKRYLAGGLGTVRGYEYQSLLISPVDSTGYHGGQQLLLANVEYKFDLGFGWVSVWEDDWDWNWDWGRDFDFDLALFFDTGMVWDDREAVIDIDDMKSSAGIAFLFGDEDDLRFDIIRPLDDGEKDWVFQVRLNRMF